MYRALAVPILAALACAAGAQDQTQATQDMDVSASIVPEVQLTVSALDFGQFVSGDALPNATSYPGVIELQGAANQAVQVSIDAGESLGRDAQNDALRALANGSGDFIGYRLRIFGSGQEFGTGTAESDNPYSAGVPQQTALDTTGERTLNVIVDFPTAAGGSRIASGAGFYEDTVTVTVLTND